MNQKPQLPRGIRNNNPGNIRVSKAQWVGKITGVNKTDDKYEEFESAPKGIRALAKNLTTYFEFRVSPDGSPIDTIDEIVDRYAPKEDANDQQGYVMDLSRWTGFGPFEKMDLHEYETMNLLIRAIIRRENGLRPNGKEWYSEAIVRKGMVLAGIEPPKKTLTASRTTVGVGIAGATTVAQVSVEHAEEAAEPVSASISSVTGQAQEILPLAERLYELSPYILGGAAVAAIAWIMWARYTDHRDGLR